MNYKQFEQLLGKPFSEVKEITNCDFKVRDRNEIKFYMNTEFFTRSLYGMVYNFISITTDHNDNVDSFCIHFHKVIDQSFYDAFVAQYGEPDNIHVISKRTVISEGKYVSDNGDFTSNVRKSEVDVREGTFDEKPLFIIWNKKDYKIKALLRHKQNISKITYSRIDH